MTSPILATDLPDGSRRYTHPRTSEEAPSVTTVLKVILKPDVDSWEERVTARYAAAHWAELGEMTAADRGKMLETASFRESQAARETGDAVHELAEKWGRGVPSGGVPKGIKGYADQYVRFLMECRPRFRESEVTLWSRTYGYAGTCDWIACIAGRTVLADIKTGKRAYPEAALQVSALANADFILRPDGTEEEIPAIDELAVLHVRPRSWRLIPVTCRQENTAAFLAARDIWGWLHDTAPRVLAA